MTYRERLCWLTAEIRGRTSPLLVANIADEDLPLLEVTAGLLRCCLEATEGVEALLTAGRYEAVFPIERAAWEIWSEFRFLIGRESRKRDAVKVEVNAILEVIETLPKIDKGAAPDDLLQRNEELLRLREGAYPELVAEVRGQRKKKQFHWSGQRRTDVFAATETDRLVYSLLSWEAHPVMGILRDVKTQRTDGGIELRFASPASEAPDLRERPAWSVTGYLWYLWVQFAKLWHIPSFELPDAVASA